MQALPDPKTLAALEGYYEALNALDQVRWLALWSADAICHHPAGALPAEGERGLREIWKMLTGPFERVRFAMEKVFYGGSGAAVNWSAEGTGVNGGSVRFEGISVFELSPDGRIQTEIAYWDPAAMLIELANQAETFQ
jgi:ketosteroid isomerase-like protein